MSEGAHSLGPATLYRTLDTLAERGLIKALPVEKTGDRPRRPWAITDEGRDALAHEVLALEATSKRLREAINESKH